MGYIMPEFWAIPSDTSKTAAFARLREGLPTDLSTGLVDYPAGFAGSEPVRGPCLHIMAAKRWRYGAPAGTAVRHGAPAA